jgi:hypothetical protein
MSQMDDRHGGKRWGGGKPEDELQARQAARQKAREYAAQVPKPKPKRLQVAQPAQGPAPQSAGPQMETSHDAPSYSPGPELGGRRRQGEGAADTGGLPGYIDSLESAHREHQAAVARIRQELMR